MLNRVHPAGCDALHGTGLFCHADEALIARLGSPKITVDRPGYGGSAEQPGRRRIDWSLGVRASCGVTFRL